MRKLAKILSVLLLCCNTAIVQGQQRTINKQTFDNLVDYVNCKYTAVYIETLRKGDTTKNDIKQYNKNIKKQLADCSYEAPVPFDTLSDLLKKKGWKDTEKGLSQKINEKKNKFKGNEMDFDEAMKLLYLDSTEVDKKITDKISDSAINNIINDIKQKMKSKEPNQETKPNQTPDTATSPQKSIKDLDGFWLWLVSIASNIVCIAGFLFHYFSRKLKKVRAKPVYKDERPAVDVASIINEPKDNPVFINNLSKQILDNVLNNPALLNALVNALVDKVASEMEKRRTWISLKPPVVEPDRQKYLRGKSGDTFGQTSDNPSGCYFKLVNENNGMAEFEYCGTLEEARNNFNSIFDNVCETEGNVNTATSVTILTPPGRLQKQNDKWKVTQKAKIRFS
ncbi:MAG: hypothetical protein LBC98_04745 [Prevotellaceae bacterium]|jgi:hypothetical protein|nr:hypothetical protein [Prevotellaceae bacterium]